MTGGPLTADFAIWPPEFAMISAERCAEIALAGLDAGLFYIPTHISADMRPRSEAVAAGLVRLGLA